MRISRIVSNVLVLLMLVSLVVMPGVALAEGDAEPITLTLLVDTGHAVYQRQAFEDMKAKYPELANYQLIVEDVPYNQLFEIIEVKVASGNTSYDIINVDGPVLSAYSKRGYLKPLDEYFTAEEMDMMADSSIEASSYNGHFMAANIMTSAQVLYYNKKLLTDAGIPLPSDDEAERMTYEQIAENCVTLMEKLNPNRDNGIWGLLFEQISRPYQMLALPNSLGGKGVADDGYTVEGVLNSQEWIDACTYYYDLFNTWQISPKGVTPDEAADLFKSGKIAYFVGGTWDCTSFLENEVLDFGYTYNPKFQDGVPVTPCGGWHLGISAYSRHPDEAARFVKYMSVDDGVKLMYESTGHMPGLKSMLESFMTNAEFDNPPKSIMRVGGYDTLNYAVTRPITPGYREWETTVTATFEDIRNGEDPKTALDAAVEKLNVDLEKYRQ